jgi:hypothetical protein
MLLNVLIIPRGFVEEAYDVSKITDPMACIGGEQGEKIGDSWCFHCLGD